jgi:serine/threonine protein kinase
MEIMARLRHPNIVQFLGACLEPHITVVIEYIAGGSLEKWLEGRRRVRLSERQILDISLDVAKAVNWLHHKRIIHRDLKPANILVDEYSAKLCDFGLAYILPEGSSVTSGAFGTPCYMAPEITKGMEYGIEVDVFSFGIVMCELATGSPLHLR